MKKITIVVPCRNEQTVLPLFFEKIGEVVEKMDNDFEFILVDDGSTDDTRGVIEYYRSKYDKIKLISFSRNFGKDAAVLAGLRMATGDYVCMMDADLQDPPDLLKDMVHAIEQEGFDCAAARRVSRKGEPPIRSAFSNAFYALMRYSSADIQKGARDFRLMTAEVKDAVLELMEYNRFTKGILGFVGFKTKWIEYENSARVAGRTKYSFQSLCRYAFDGIYGFTRLPVNLIHVTTGLSALATLGLLVTMIIQAILPAVAMSPTIIILFGVLLASTAVLFSLGITANYLCRILDEVRCRPDYIVRDTDNLSKNKNDGYDNEQ